MSVLKTPDVVIKIAEKEVGYLEKKSASNLYDKTANAGRANYTKFAYEMDTKYPTFYNGKKNGFAWCDCFVDWCFVTAFGETAARAMLYQPTKSAGAGCVYSAGYYRAHGAFFSAPKVGDQIFFGTKGKETHTGLVYKVDSSRVYTIEGNTSSASGVVANGGAVAKKSYPLNYAKIVGYGRPKYDATAGKISTQKKAESRKTEEKTYKPGTELNLKSVKLYLSSTIGNHARTISGKYYLYDGKDVNGRFRITNKASSVEKFPSVLYVTGWVNKGDI